jgi:hypothetical protein
MPIESGPDHAMRIVRNPIVVRLWRFLERLDVFYVVPVVIAVAAFIIAVLAYYR